MKLIPIVLAVSLGLISCSKNESSPDVSPTTITGIASDAIIVDGLVRVYHTSGGSSLGSARTDINGNFELKNLKLNSGYYRFELTGGSYIEEASGAEIQLTSSHSLDSIAYLEPGTPVDVTISPLTSVQYDYTRCLMKEGELENNADKEAASQLASMFEFNVTAEDPINITHQPTETRFTSGYKYGFIQAARSQLVREINELNGLTGHSGFSSIDFAMMMREDLQSDCVLNGFSNSTQLRFGVYDVSVNTYRTDMAAALITAANSDYNKSGFDANDVLGLANRISTNTERIYADGDIQEFDLDGPNIIFDNTSGQRLVGDSTISFRVYDKTEIGIVELYIDGVFYADFFGESASSLSIHSSDFDDGSHTIEVVAYDVIGNRSSKSINVITSNFAVPFDLISPQTVNTSSYNLDIEFEDSSETIFDVSLNGVSATEFFNHWRISTFLDPGLNNLVVTIRTDQRIVDETIAICFDNEDPSINLDGSMAFLRDKLSGFESFDYLYNNDIQNDLLITGETSSIGNLSVTEADLNSGQIAYVLASISDNDFGCENSIVSQYRLKHNGEWINEWTDSALASDDSFIVPFVKEWIGESLLRSSDGDELDVYVSATDLAGNEITESFKTELALDFDKINITAPYSNSNLIQAFQYNDGKGGLISDCIVVSSSCSINMIQATDVLLLHSSDVRYTEPSTSTVIFSEESIDSFVFVDGEFTQSWFNPLNNIFSAMINKELALGSDIVTAVAAAKTAFESMYGYNPMLRSDLGQFPTLNRLNSFVDMHLVTLSETAFELFGGFGLTKNSLTLSKAMASDIEDGSIDGLFYGEQILVSGTLYDGVAANEKYAVNLLSNAYSDYPQFVDTVIPISMGIHEPALPEVSVAINNGVWKGVQSVSATVTADTDYMLVAKVDGTEVHIGSSDFTIDSTLFADGTHTLTIEIEDRYKQKASVEALFVSDNNGPTISVVSSRLAPDSSYVLEIDLSDAHSINPNTTVNQQSVALVAGSNSLPMSLTNSYNVFEIEAEDEFGNLSSKTYSVVKIPAILSQAWSGIVNLFGTENIESDAFIFFELDSELLSSYDFGESVSFDSTDIEEGIREINLVVMEDGVAEDSMHSVLVDNSGPVITMPTDLIRLTEPFSVSLGISDLYSELNEVTINGQVKASAGSTYTISDLNRSGSFTNITATASDVLGNSTSINKWIATPVLPIDVQHDSLSILTALPANTAATVSSGEVSVSATSGQSLVLPLAALPSGQNQITLAFSNTGDNPSQKVIGNLNVDNTPPVIDAAPFLFITNLIDSLGVTITDVHSSVVAASIDNVAVPLTVGSYSDTRVFSPTYDYDEVRIAATDQVGLVSEEIISIVDVRRIQALNSVRGSIVLLNQTPWTNAKGSIEIKLNGTSLTRPPKSNPWILNTALFADGLYSLEVIVSHADGQNDSFEHSFFIDNNAPVISISSINFTNNNAYQLEGAVTDLESSVAELLINGSQVTLNPDGSFASAQVLSSAVTNFEVSAVDESGNMSTEYHAVAYDYLAPVVKWTTSSVRRWSYSGDRTIYSSTTSNTSNLGELVVYPQYRSQSSDFTLVNSNEDIMWLNLTVSDGYSVDSYYTNIQDLSFEYRYLVDGLQNTGWSSIVVDSQGRAKLPLDRNSLSEAFFFSNPDAIHTIEFRSEDEIGNVGEYSISFTVKGAITSGLTKSVVTNPSLITIGIDNLNSEIGAGGLDLSTITLTNQYDFGVWVNVGSTSKELYMNRASDVFNKKDNGFYRVSKEYFYSSPDTSCVYTPLSDGQYIWSNSGTNSRDFTNDGKTGDFASVSAGITRVTVEASGQSDGDSWEKVSSIPSGVHIDVVNGEIVSQTTVSNYDSTQSSASPDDYVKLVGYDQFNLFQYGSVFDTTFEDATFGSDVAEGSFLHGNLLLRDTYVQSLDVQNNYYPDLTPLIKGDFADCNAGVFSRDVNEFVRTPSYPKAVKTADLVDFINILDLDSTGVVFGEYIYLAPNESISQTISIPASEANLILDEVVDYNSNSRITSTLEMDTFHNVLYEAVVAPSGFNPDGVDLPSPQRNAVGININTAFTR